jgi:hypothetical protein
MPTHTIGQSHQIAVFPFQFHFILTAGIAQKLVADKNHVFIVMTDAAYMAGSTNLQFHFVILIID